MLDFSFVWIGRNLCVLLTSSVKLASCSHCMIRLWSIFLRWEFCWFPRDDLLSIFSLGGIKVKSMFPSIMLIVDWFSSVTYSPVCGLLAYRWPLPWNSFDSNSNNLLCPTGKANRKYPVKNLAILPREQSLCYLRRITFKTLTIKWRNSK